MNQERQVSSDIHDISWFHDPSLYYLYSWVGPMSILFRFPVFPRCPSKMLTARVILQLPSGWNSRAAHPVLRYFEKAAWNAKSEVESLPPCHTGTVTQASGGILFVAWLSGPRLVNLVGSGRQGNEHDYGTLVKQKWTRSELCFIFAVLCPSQHWGWNSQVGPTSIRRTFSGIG